MVDRSVTYGKDPCRVTLGKLRTKFWFRWGDLRTTITPQTEFESICVEIGSIWIGLATMVRSNSIQHR